MKTKRDRAFSVERTFSMAAPLPEGEIDAVVDLFEPHDVVLGVGSARLSVRITVSARSADDAVRMSREAIDQALSGMPSVGELLAVEAIDADELTRRLAEPPETFLGVTEVAQLLGVSRQRVSELRGTARFPSPIAELAAGPVWTGSSLGRFVEAWDRRPGRPRNASLVSG